MFAVQVLRIWVHVERLVGMSTLTYESLSLMVWWSDSFLNGWRRMNRCEWICLTVYMCVCVYEYLYAWMCTTVTTLLFINLLPRSLFNEYRRVIFYLILNPASRADWQHSFLQASRGTRFPRYFQNYSHIFDTLDHLAHPSHLDLMTNPWPGAEWHRDGRTHNFTGQTTVLWTYEKVGGDVINVTFHR